MKKKKKWRDKFTFGVALGTISLCIAAMADTAIRFISEKAEEMIHSKIEERFLEQELEDVFDDETYDFCSEYKE